MPKLKTKKSAKKRFRLTKSGKVKRNKAYAGHIMGKKTRKRKRNLRKSAIAVSGDAKRIKKMIPNA